MASNRETLGHYEIIRPIGAGGMGEVFVARDPKLGRKVAIKLLPLRLANERDTLTRFTQEARSASALNHPNIVTIHEVGTAEGSPYIVMEFIDGRDLRALITEGPVPVRQVLDIAMQIGDGLAAAHERGIVHRDLKPENIMITRDGFVKILDFGLAKVIGPTPEGEHTLQLDMPGTTPGTILGTVGYMSPEQATGRRIDFRSDLFAFGAILHELVTGTAAFDGETAIDTLSAILHHDPPAVTRSNARVPVQLADIIKRMLAKSPDDRYSSTRDLSRELRLLRERVVAEESGFHRPIEPPKKPVAAIVAAAGLAVFLAGAVYLANKNTATTDAATAAAPVAGKKYLAVMRFKDLSGDPNGQVVVDGFGETLSARLAGFPSVQVMRPPATYEEVDPRKAARELGANLLLSGSMMREGERIRVTYVVLDPRTGREWRDLVDGNVANLFGVQDEVAEKVARNLDLGAMPIRPALDPAISQQRYLQALGHLRRSDSEESVNAAIEILEHLGNSASVQAVLARAYLAKYQLTNQPQYARLASDAAERALRADAQSLDVNVTLGELRRATGRYPEAIAAFMRVLSQQPNNAEAVLGLAETYKDSGDLEKAEATYKRAIALQPNHWSVYSKLGGFYYKQTRYEDAAAQFQKVIQLVPDNERAYSNLGAMYQLLGRHDEAVRVFQRSLQRVPSAAAYSNLGLSYYSLGRFAESAGAFQKAVNLNPNSALYWRNLADALRFTAGREADSRIAYERALTLCDDALRVNPGDGRAHRTRACALAKLGRLREARSAILRALELEPKLATNAYEAAVIANLGNDEEEMTARIEQALRLGYDAKDLQRDPEFAGVRKSGRLEAIIAGFRSSPEQR